MIEFSLLLCLYEKENPEHLKECFESINQVSVLPREIVIVKDGPLTDELELVIDTHEFPTTTEGQSINVITIALPENVTLGPARAAGVEAVTCDWVAIMDTDDICRRDRFEKQLQVIEGNPDISLIGGQIAEFVDTPEHTVTTRIVPTGHDDIVKFAKLRNPFNHMTVMFKKDAVLKAGNYRFFPWFEDYDLWTRMINNGIICANLSDVLVDARIDNNTFGRRRGMAYIRMELKLQKQLRNLKLISMADYIRNVILRVPARVLPSGLLASVYRKFIR